MILENTTKVWIGVKDGKACDSSTVKSQINHLVMHNRLELVDEKGRDLTNWDEFYDGTLQEPIALNVEAQVLNIIIDDRLKRVDQKILMASRPSFAIVTIGSLNNVIRFEYFCGHNKLEQLFDVRSRELRKLDLKPSYEDKVNW